MDIRNALKIRWELKEDVKNGVEPVRHANTFKAFEATAILAEEFEKTEVAQAILREFEKEVPRK